MKNKFAYTLLIICFSTFLIACKGEKTFVPKPKGFHFIELPPHEYVSMENTNFPYTLEYSKHAKIQKDTSFMAEPHWIEVYYPNFQATINIAYKPILKNGKRYQEIINDSHRLTNKHHVKAYAIDEIVLKPVNGNRVVLFQLEGDVPSQFQFYVTDTTSNYLRAALYFPTSVKNDSLAPVIEYVKKDMMKMIESIRWKPIGKKIE